MDNKKVTPKVLSGFRDFFAEDIFIREFVINTFKKVFEKYGYEPLETPALEYANIFSGEVGDEAEKLFYRFKDNGDRDIMLKYEVMIPMCRAVAENFNNITFPYKRYQIQNVWRAEKPQKGRYREFTQCDADTINSSSVIADAEFIQMGIETLEKLGFKSFRANISNRKLLNGIVQYSKANPDDFIPICISIDKLPKIGQEAVEKELKDKRKISPSVIKSIMSIITLTGNTEDLLKQLKIKLAGNLIAQEGLEELDIIFNYLKTVNVSLNRYQFSPFIARGLAYYTGPIWEFEIIDGDIGSVAGCGRYDNTIGRFMNKIIPATGGSFGIDRIVEVLKERKMVNSTKTSSRVLVTMFDESTTNKSIMIANYLRQQNIATMLFPNVSKLDKQLKYANRKGILFVIIIGPEEAEKNLVKLKNMKTGEQKSGKIEEIIDIISRQ